MRRDRTLAGPPYLRTAGGAHLRVISLDLRPTHLQPLTYGFQGHLPSLGRGAPWGSRREACKLRSHPHPSRPSVVPPSPLKGEGSGGRPLRRMQEPSFPFVGAGHWPARRCTRRVQEAAPYGSTPATTCSAKPGADVESHQLQFLESQGPVARIEPRKTTQILRAGSAAKPSKYASPRNGVLGDGRHGGRGGAAASADCARPLAVLW